jgi:hypothetical protein
MTRMPQMGRKNRRLRRPICVIRVICGQKVTPSSDTW